MNAAVAAADYKATSFGTHQFSAIHPFHEESLYAATYQTPNYNSWAAKVLQFFPLSLMVFFLLLDICCA